MKVLSLPAGANHLSDRGSTSYNNVYTTTAYLELLCEEMLQVALARSLGRPIAKCMAQGLADLKAAPSYSTSAANPGKALNQFCAANRHSVILYTKGLGGPHSPSVVGTFTFQAALGTLTGSGLQYEYIDATWLP